MQFLGLISVVPSALVGICFHHPAFELTQRLLLLPQLVVDGHTVGSLTAMAKRQALCQRSREDKLYSRLGLFLSTFTSVLALTELLLL